MFQLQLLDNTSCAEYLFIIIFLYIFRTSNYKAEPEDNMNQTESKEHLEICKMMSICIAHAANCGGLGSLTGTGPNVVFKGQSDMLVYYLH